MTLKGSLRRMKQRIRNAFKKIKKSFAETTKMVDYRRKQRKKVAESQDGRTATKTDLQNMAGPY